MSRKILLFAPCAFNLAETSLMVEIAKGVRHHLIASQIFDVHLISDGGEFGFTFIPRLVKSQATVRWKTTIRHYLSRDRLVTLAAVLKRSSIVVIGGRKKWWPTREKILAWRLRRFGHDVILTEAT